MTEPQTHKLIEKVDELWQFNTGLVRSLNLFHWVGYGFLLLTLFDLFEIFVPPRFMNPVWEFQMLGAMVERVPVPLIGLVLVFCGEPNLRARWERSILKFLSWTALLFAVWFLLLIPLGISNTIRIDRNSNAEMNAQVKQEITKFQQVKEQLEEAKTKEEVEKFLFRLDRQVRLPTNANFQPLEAVKQQVLFSIETSEMRITTEAKNEQRNRRLTLLKKSVKWNLGALVSGCLFFLVWQNTRWARFKK
ncbi:MAG: HpsJ family protein [Hydrococcus sp. Prado102]|jgi:hypothetical protein|nr:HpsJ family protein [Hydrococcus sp. Prado102]